MSRFDKLTQRIRASRPERTDEDRARVKDAKKSFKSKHGRALNEGEFLQMKRQPTEAEKAMPSRKSKKA